MINMYVILKNLILMKNTSKEVLENKVWNSWAANGLTDEEKDELLQLIFENLSPESEAPEMKELYTRIIERLDDLEKDMSAVKQDIVLMKSSSDIGENETTQDTLNIQEWKAYDAIVNIGYDYGEIVEHRGKYYINSLNGVKNVWEPGTDGIDERYWIEITKEDAEAIVSGKKTANDVDQLMKIIENN